MSFLDLYSAAQILKITPEEMGRLFALGLLKAEPGAHGAYVVSERDVYSYLLAQKGSHGR
jgi:hypothetical protein